MENITFGRLNDAPENAPPAVGKAMKILDIVAASRIDLGVSELARRTGMNKSSVHGLLGALLHEGLLARPSGEKTYVLGPRLIELGARAMDHQARAAGTSALGELASATGETALFGCLDGDHVRIVARREGSKSLYLSASEGSIVPVLAGALGRAYLAALAPSRAAEFLAQCDLPRFTAASITDVATYESEILRARRNGYAVERGEYLPGIAAAASALEWQGATYFLWVVGIAAAYDSAGLDGIGRLAAAATKHLRLTLDPAAAVNSEGNGL